MQYAQYGTKCNKSIGTGREDGALGGYVGTRIKKSKKQYTKQHHMTRM